MPTHYEGDTRETLALDTWIKLVRANASLESRINHRDSIGGLTVSQFSVLEILLHLGPMPQCELAAKMLKSSGNVTMVIDNLEKQGLVRRQPDENDRRISRVVLMPAGRDLITAVFPHHVAIVADEFSPLSAEEQAELGRLLRKLGKKGE